MKVLLELITVWIDLESISNPVLSHCFSSSFSWPHFSPYFSYFFPLYPFTYFCALQPYLLSSNSCHPSSFPCILYSLLLSLHPPLLCFFLSSFQHVSWWTRGSSLLSHPRAAQPQVPCSLWRMQCTFPTSSSRETGTAHPARPVSSTPAQTERATPWLLVHLFESTTSCSPLSQSCTGRSLSSFMRATMVSCDEWEQFMAKCIS